MRSYRYPLAILVVALVTLMVASSAAAQDVSPPPPPLPPPEGAMTMAVGGERFGFIGMMELHDKVVTGAPYSAQATTETTQTLSDGNQILRTETSQVYRDSQGRTRREHTLSGVGPWMFFASPGPATAGAGPVTGGAVSNASGAPRQMIAINDPVAGVHYMLDPQEKTAVKMPAPPTGQMATKMKKRFNAMNQENLAESTTESLGNQTIEGLLAQGTRVTETIPAGKIGNVKPITIISERWYSTQLQTYVLTKRSDPRFGETAHKLTNISLTEPAPDLFQVPADYTIKEGKGGMRVTYEAPAK